MTPLSLAYLVSPACPARGQPRTRGEPLGRENAQPSD
jgi:hypothetical protein